MLQRKTTRPQCGAIAVEFSLVVILFLMIALGVLELARAMYLYNTLAIVTQRAARLAANVNFHDAAALDAVRQQAIFRSTPGTLALGAPITDAHIRIDYLALPDAGTMTPTAIASANLPACPLNNRIRCLKDPNDAACIRLVRAQICDPAITDSCSSVQYQALISLLRLPLSLPTSAAIVRAETLGAVSGDAPCP